MAGEACNEHTALSNSFFDFAEKPLTASHIMSVHPASAFEASQLLVQYLDQFLVVPVI